MVKNCDTMLEILHKHKPFQQIRDPENCDVRDFFLWRFFTWPRNYYNDNKIYNLNLIFCKDSSIKLASFISVWLKKDWNYRHPCPLWNTNRFRPILKWSKLSVAETKCIICCEYDCVLIFTQKTKSVYLPRFYYRYGS